MSSHKKEEFLTVYLSNSSPVLQYIQVLQHVNYIWPWTC